MNYGRSYFNTTVTVYFYQKKDNFQSFKLITKEKIVKKIGEFRIQDWLLTCDEQDKNFLVKILVEFLEISEVFTFCLPAHQMLDLMVNYRMH